MCWTLRPSHLENPCHGQRRTPPAFPVFDVRLCAANVASRHIYRQLGRGLAVQVTERQMLRPSFVPPRPLRQRMVV